MVCVAVLTGVADRDELAPHADVVLDTIADLPRWLGLQS
jgi:phosphoglycolate phosphatase